MSPRTRTSKGGIKAAAATRPHPPQSKRGLPGSGQAASGILFGATPRTVAYLDIFMPNRQLDRCELKADPSFLGRGGSCHVRLPLSDVSKRHAQVVREGDDCVIEDLRSAGGVFVNGVRVSRCILHDGDQIGIGAAKLIFTQHRIRTLT